MTTRGAYNLTEHIPTESLIKPIQKSIQICGSPKTSKNAKIRNRIQLLELARTNVPMSPATEKRAEKTHHNLRMQLDSYAD